MTHTATQIPANSWTIAYRKPRANKFHRVTNWCGTWEQARVMAGRFTERQDHEVQVYYVTTAAYEAWELAEDRARIARGEITAEYAASRYEDHGNVMVDSGKRIRMTDTGTLPADLIASFGVPADAPAWHDMRTPAEVADIAASIASAVPQPVTLTPAEEVAEMAGILADALPHAEPAGWNITSGETVTVDGMPGEFVLETEDEQPTNETTSLVAVYPKDPDHPHFCRSLDASVDQIHRVVWPIGTRVSDYDELTGEVVADPHPEANPPGQAFVAILWEGSTVPSVTLQSEVHRVL